eukprot:7471432-Pyramimonas_sp.AAC.1
MMGTRAALLTVHACLVVVMAVNEETDSYGSRMWGAVRRHGDHLQHERVPRSCVECVPLHRSD